MVTVEGPGGRSVKPDELLMRILCNGDNPPSVIDRGQHRIVDVPVGGAR